MTKPLLIFDLDGTLVNSESQIGLALNEARKEFNYKELTSLTISELLGLPIDFFLDDLKLFPEEKMQLITRFREILMQAILVKNDVYPGVVEFLQFSKAGGFDLAIATSKPTYLAELVIQNSELNGFFGVIQGTEGFPPKPDPTCILRAMSRSSAESGIMFGDRIEDIAAANAAGIRSIGIGHSFHSLQQLEEMGAALVFTNFKELAISEKLKGLLVN